MTCAKKVVTARLVLPSGLSFEGRNDCAQPQDVCPREPGEGYDKCHSECAQFAHAEVVAIRAAWAAGISALAGATMFVDHNHVCVHCAGMMTLLRINYECTG